MLGHFWVITSIKSCYFAIPKSYDIMKCFPYGILFLIPSNIPEGKV